MTERHYGEVDLRIYGTRSEMGKAAAAEAGMVMLVWMVVRCSPSSLTLLILCIGFLAIYSISRRALLISTINS